MEYISSDTNVWVDFATIDRLEYPFRLPYTYLMNNDAVEDEILSPPGLGDKLLQLGLQAVELTTEEFYLAEKYTTKYAKPSLHDCIALAIAKSRGIILLTGDGPLRKAAIAEGVQVMGTIGVLDQLVERELIERQEYMYCIEELLRHNGGKVRLPVVELEKRLGEGNYER